MRARGTHSLKAGEQLWDAMAANCITVSVLPLYKKIVCMCCVRMCGTCAPLCVMCVHVCLVCAHVCALCACGCVLVHKEADTHIHKNMKGVMHTSFLLTSI